MANSLIDFRNRELKRNEGKVNPWAANLYSLINSFVAAKEKKRLEALDQQNAQRDQDYALDQIRTRAEAQGQAKSQAKEDFLKFSWNYKRPSGDPAPAPDPGLIQSQGMPREEFLGVTTPLIRKPLTFPDKPPSRETAGVAGQDEDPYAGINEDIKNQEEAFKAVSQALQEKRAYGKDWPGRAEEKGYQTELKGLESAFIRQENRLNKLRDIKREEKLKQRVAGKKDKVRAAERAEDKAEKTQIRLQDKEDQFAKELEGKEDFPPGFEDLPLEDRVEIMRRKVRNQLDLTLKENQGLAQAEELVANIDEMMGMIGEDRGEDKNWFRRAKTLQNLPNYITFFHPDGENAQEFKLVRLNASDTLLRLKSGAQINEQEYDRLNQLFPQAFRFDSVDMRQLARFRRLFSNIHARIMGRKGAPLSSTELARAHFSTFGNEDMSAISDISNMTPTGNRLPTREEAQRILNLRRQRNG